MQPFYWLVAFAILLAIEVGTMALTTIWFAGGALAAFFVSLFGTRIEFQLGVFVIVSFILLFFTRPFASRFINRNTVKTNVDSLIGRHARVTIEINNDQMTGAAVVGGQEWTARSADEETVIPVGTMVQIQEIRGVKLIVKKIQEEI